MIASPLTIILIIAVLQTTVSEIDNRVITSLKYSSVIVKPTVVNGKIAKKGQLPYLVSIKEPSRILLKKKRLWSNLCGGSIISETQVLTAAHCFELNNFYYAKNFKKLRVVAGNLNTDLISTGKEQKSGDSQWRRIKKVRLHEKFNFPANDLAIATVNVSWVFTDNVNLINLARWSTDYNDCASAGFGTIRHGQKAKRSTALRVAQINVIPRYQCSVFWEMNMDNYICSNSAVTDVSNGDSGGPLTCRRTLDRAEVRGKDLLVGVVSGKNFDKTTLFTRVSAYRKWINSCATSRLSLSLLIVSVFCIYV